MQIEITRVVDLLIGYYGSCARHEIDMESVERLETVREILIHMVNQLCKNTLNGHDSVAHSVVEVGDKSKKILSEIQARIDDLNYDLMR